jgi:hypothetical protein
MQAGFKRYGYLVWPILIAAFFIIPPLIRTLSSDSEDVMRRHMNGAVLVFSGCLIFWIAARADKKNGLDVRSKYTWTSEILVSEHRCFGIPMRLVGVGLVVISVFL